MSSLLLIVSSSHLYYVSYIYITIRFGDPSVVDMIDALEMAISRVHETCVYCIHEQVAVMYSWHSVAARTEKVYESILSSPSVGVHERIERYLSMVCQSYICTCLLI